ncbi:MAG TPA: cytochrome c [Candidatus Acidoferrales bacterium]|nr:cytochrome c [Candidatus Acidoferrales bacterium]
MKAALIFTNEVRKKIALTGLVGLMLAGLLSSTVAAAPTTAAEKGKQFFTQSCVNCHGMNGQGVPNLGANLQTSKLVATSSDNQLVSLIEHGVPANSPINKSRIPMPPKGANASLTTQDIHDIVAYIRQLQKTHKGK